MVEEVKSISNRSGPSGYEPLPVFRTRSAADDDYINPVLEDALPTFGTRDFGNNMRFATIEPRTGNDPTRYATSTIPQITAEQTEAMQTINFVTNPKRVKRENVYLFKSSDGMAWGTIVMTGQ
jgi:hypothetical protein